MGRVVITHSTYVEGLIPLLRKLALHPQVYTITPAVISRVRGRSTGLRLRVSAPLIGGWKATALSAAKRTALIGELGPGAISRKRRDRWDSLEDALAHLQHKKAFSRWDKQVLHDYVRHGTRADHGQRVLAFSREVETAIYNTLPHHIERLLARHPLQCPAAFIGGSHSRERQMVGMALTDRVTQGRITLLEGSHLFPMEKPEATAAAIEAALLAM
jgi:pimeloyl-ACP methyl ester carboxylesterase